MRTGKLSVEKARKTTDSKTYSVKFLDFPTFNVSDVELPDTPFDGVTVTLNQPNVRRLLDMIEKHTYDALQGHLFEFDYRPDRITSFPLEDYKNSWRRMVRTNDDPITEYQITDLMRRFRFVERTSLLENFSKDFAAFLLKALDFYDIDVSCFELRSDTYLANQVCLGPLYINFSGDVQFAHTWSKGDTQYVILHELRHVMQFHRGWLKIAPFGIGLEYKGQSCPKVNHLRYSISPAEYDANRFTMESPLWTRRQLHQFDLIFQEVQAAPDYQHNRWCEAYG